MTAKGQQYAAERESGSEATLLGAPHHHVTEAALVSAAGSSSPEGACRVYSFAEGSRRPSA
eukprot:4242837-Heterocapsa_arctica.AAC.1